MFYLGYRFIYHQIITMVEDIFARQDAHGLIAKKIKIQTLNSRGKKNGN